jgi:hypothetical protein
MPKENLRGKKLPRIVATAHERPRVLERLAVATRLQELHERGDVGRAATREVTAAVSFAKGAASHG